MFKGGRVIDPVLYGDGDGSYSLSEFMAMSFITTKIMQPLHVHLLSSAASATIAA